MEIINSVSPSSHRPAQQDKWLDAARTPHILQNIETFRARSPATALDLDTVNHIVEEEIQDLYDAHMSMREMQGEADEWAAPEPSADELDVMVAAIHRELDKRLSPLSYAMIEYSEYRLWHGWPKTERERIKALLREYFPNNQYEGWDSEWRVNPLVQAPDENYRKVLRDVVMKSRAA